MPEASVRPVQETVTKDSLTTGQSLPLFYNHSAAMGVRSTNPTMSIMMRFSSKSLGV